MKQLIVLLLCFASLNVAAQDSQETGNNYFIYATDTLTNSQNDTVTIPQRVHKGSMYASIYTKEVAITGTATGTVALQGSIDGTNWFSVAIGTNAAAVGASQTATTSGETWYSVIPLAGATTYGSAQYRYLRAIVAQTGTGTSWYHVQLIYKR